MIDGTRGRKRIVVMGHKGLDARWVLQFYTHVWVCAVSEDQQSE